MRERSILDAARTLFFERGYDGVGVDAIAEAAGVSTPAIYRVFENKEEILATLFDEALDRLMTRSGAPDDDPDDDLRRLAQVHAEFALGDRELLSIYAREDRSLTGAHRRRVHRRQRQFATRWRDALRRVNKTASEGELISTTYALIGLLISAAHWPTEALETEGLTALLVTLVERAARPD